MRALRIRPQRTRNDVYKAERNFKMVEGQASTFKVSLATVLLNMRLMDIWMLGPLEWSCGERLMLMLNY